MSNFTNILIIIETTPTLCVSLTTHTRHHLPRITNTKMIQAHIVVTQISDFTVRLYDASDCLPIYAIDAEYCICTCVYTASSLVEYGLVRSCVFSCDLATNA